MIARSPDAIAPPVRAGFVPLVDAAPLIVAARLGFASAEGLEIVLVRERSWATLRDHMAVARLDVAHMLGPMAVADAIGLTPMTIGLVVPMALGFGGNTITVSAALWRELASAGAVGTADAGQAAYAIAEVARRRERAGQPRLRLAVVHSHSAHYYQLAYWLGWAGVAPAHDIDLLVLPPQQMARALATSDIDGFCAGEPWGTVAVDAADGHVLTTSAHIWQQAPEKVLAVRAHYAREAGDRVQALVRAVYRAALWCDEPANHPALAELLAGPDLVAAPVRAIREALARRPGGLADAAAMPGFLAFAAGCATFPWTSHAAWFYAQMVRWGQTPHEARLAEAAAAAFRPDLYRAALADVTDAIPNADTRIEGTLAVRGSIRSSAGSLEVGPDTFFDGRVFDPADIPGYVAGFSIRT